MARIALSFVLIFGALILFVFPVSYGDAPHMINYQGKLTTASGGCLDDTLQMTFTIYADSFGITSEWTETQTEVVVKEGIFNVLLGSVNHIPGGDTLFDGTIKYLGVLVDSDPEMTPLKPITSAAYAFHATIADSVVSSPTSGLVSVEGVSNPGGNIDLIQAGTIIIIPDDGNNNITLGETHSVRSDNPHAVTAAQTGAPIAIAGVSNAGGNVDFIQQDAISITPNDVAKNITFGETHSYRLDNPHAVSETQTGGLVSVDGVSNPGGNVDFIAGSNMTITPNEGTNTVTFSAMGGASGWVDDGSVVRLETSSDSVGIGTASPSQKLGIAGHMALEGIVANQSPAIEFCDPDGPEWQVQYVGGGLNFWENGVGSRMIIEDGGEVGIGIATPSYKLHVNGGFFGNTVNTGLGDNELYAMNQNVRSTDSPTFNRVHLNDYGTALGGFHVGSTTDPGTGNLIVDGKVGVGITPVDELDVDGDIRIRDGGIKDDGGTTRIVLTDNGPLQLSEDGGLASLTLDTDGDVGIGTTTPNPDAKLHVAGTANYAGYFTSNNLSATTHVVHSEFTGSGSYDGIAVYGKSRPTDNYGIGGYFEGGYYAVHARIFPAGSGGYTGVYSSVFGGAGTNYGVYSYVGGFGTNYGVYSYAGGSGTNYAGYFSGLLYATSVSGGIKAFMIDHPLDPENKYLYHSSVESPDMMNVYNGNVYLDANGEATVELPAYFETLNRDFRYQLTCIGGFAPVYIASKISGNSFKIAGGQAGMEISWQVTGIRKDPVAEANRVQVEVDKPERERGKYLNPEAYGLSEENGIHYQQRDRAEESRQGEND